MTKTNNGQNGEDWPVWATEAVHIEAYNPDWRAKGERETKRLAELLRPYGVREIEHMGSTSVPGLSAKPIIDLMARIPDYGELDSVIEALSAEDWHYVPPELDGNEWRRFFVKVKSDKRQCHLHLMREDEEHWDRQIAFRDKLRRNPELAGAYDRLKQELAERYQSDREAYTRAKSEFVQNVLETEQ
ncbi:GrpB family protein [Saccharibacillus sp. CPCC 101409]|uniref:GrpB family protein n=1 Tax=Saccharibacillus sp. CPCC 101409 TaxID=3058041 RepID=UPI00267255CC|nr:GrpB family protein [Saccharibacillus sp. CPCC 101409]MDO3412475.1 GrpB family protein [Saccharibacillus sp. CPCC 101409]